MTNLKTIAFILSGFLFLISCSPRDSFNSLGEGEDEQRLASEEPQHREEIKNLVNQKEIVKIGAGKKTRPLVDLSETVGQNQLKDEEGEGQVALIDETVTIEVGVKEPEFTKNLSLLFYIDSKKSTCVRQFRKYGKSFLSHLNKAPDWEMAFSFHRDSKVAPAPGASSWERAFSSYGNTEELIKLQQRAGGYVLSKNNSRPERVFTETLKAYYPSANEHSSRPNQGPHHVLNPLKGLSQSLDVFSSNTKGQKVVLYFDDDYPYYTAEEWRNFYEKHHNLTVLFISKRQGNLSNLIPGVEVGMDLLAVLGCELSTPRFVTDTLNHILSRLK